MVVESMSSHLDDRSQSNEQVDALTPEDIAWVDSCLIKEIPDISDSNWNHVREALLEILTLHPEDVETSAAASDILQGGTIDINMVPSNNEEPTFPSGSDDDLILVNEVKIAADDSQNHGNIENFVSLSFRGNPFLPTYNDEEEEKENIQTASSLELSEIGSELPISDIFRVWDLNLPAVEDELVEQLNKALSENSVQSVPAMVGTFSGLNDFKEELLDDLIDGISGLSLEQNN